ncbi:MAG: pyridoxamine 5'-phosphate oxidase [Pseudomonadales bacterium]|nr:pyridoxamine 5'-phosphate oxidase [Pseudomonadales bacterium]
MPKPFTDIAFTDSVREAQALYGSSEFNTRIEARAKAKELDESTKVFLEERDSIFIASLNEEGWPYVQHKGGPHGFLKIINDSKIRFADFRGNRQYISVGNLSSNNRVSLIVMDYPNRRRLKIWGTVEIVEYQDDPTLVEALAIPTYRARVERGILINIEAFDWNCPQHITPRYTDEEFKKIKEPILEVSSH